MMTRLLLVGLVALQLGAAPPAAEGNAALRYWSAFARLQDTAISDDQAKELNAILDGTAPYSDLKYRDLVGRNKSALDTMARGVLLAHCDWGVDYELGSDAPVDYVRRALALGRLNVLYSFHLLQNGRQDAAVKVLGSGLRFSQDVSAGGSIFAALAAKNLLASHLRAIVFAVHTSRLSAQDKSALQTAVERLGREPIDWQSAVKREPHGSTSALPGVQREKQDLAERLQQTLSRLR